MDEDLEFTLEQLADESRPVRKIGLQSLSDMPRARVDRFRAFWADLNRERRHELASALVEQAEANVRLNFCTILRHCLHDDDARVRKIAVEGLWEDSRASLVSPLTAMLAGDPAAEVRAAAAISLGRFVLMGELGDVSETTAQEASTALREAWLRPREVNEVRRRALEGLAYLGSPEVVDMIHSSYFDEDELMRQSAVFAMGRNADRRWAKPVLAELGSQHAAMRFEAATAAGELALLPAVRSLIRLLDDLDSSVREAAALALGQIGGPEARRALQACRDSSDEALAQAAEDALEELAFNSGTLGTPMFSFAQSVGRAGDENAAVDDDEYDEEFEQYDELMEEDETFYDDDDDNEEDEPDWDEVYEDD